MTLCQNIENFILVKYTKKTVAIPDHNELMFRTMLEQLNYFYPYSTIHIITNEKHKDTAKLIWHYDLDLETSHITKLKIYGLLTRPAMYIDNDILLIRPFEKKHLSSTAPFNLYQYSARRSLQSLCSKNLEWNSDKQYNCGIVWIARPNKQIVTELQDIRNNYFNNKELIERQHVFYNNDEHPVSYFVSKYNLKMKMFREVNAFRYKEKNPFDMQSIHYTGIKNKTLFTEEYKEVCKSRVRIYG